MPTAWLLCEKVLDEYIPIGLGTTEDQAREMAIDGDYLIVPVESGQLYPNITAESMDGAIHYNKMGTNAAIQDLSIRLDNLKTSAVDQLAQMNIRLDSLEARITALETG